MRNLIEGSTALELIGYFAYFMLALLVISGCFVTIFKIVRAEIADKKPSVLRKPAENRFKNEIKSDYDREFRGKLKGIAGSYAILIMVMLIMFYIVG